MRRSLQESWRHLETMGVEVPRREDGTPHIPERMPHYDDDVLGLSFFRERLRECDFSSLTMPRTFFGRSEFANVTFRASDLSESRLCWNDFVDCDFSQAELRGADLRAANFTRCAFASANLSDADLRTASFDSCDFSGANFGGAIVETYACADLGIEPNVAGVRWVDDAGEEPPGG
jgi:uncharacterized protein YjbI with pentapeptide repeats